MLFCGDDRKAEMQADDACCCPGFWFDKFARRFCLLTLPHAPLFYRLLTSYLSCLHSPLILCWPSGQACNERVPLPNSAYFLF